MRADSSLFALKSKKYYYFDRDYNTRAHDWVDYGYEYDYWLEWKKPKGIK